MKPTIIGNATLYQGDCLEILPTLGKVDAVVTDPPYVGLVGGEDKTVFGGVGRRKKGQDISVGDQWAASFKWAEPAWDLCRLGAMVFSGNKGIGDTENAFPKSKTICVLAWHKVNAPPTGANLPRYTTEYVWCGSKEPGIKWDRLSSTLINIPGLPAGCFASERIVNGGKSAHPTQKPVAVMSELVGLCDGSILDPFMGTGTTGVACAKLGRKFIGIELEPKYFDIACKRIEDAYAQPDMFVEQPVRAVQEALL